MIISNKFINYKKDSSSSSRIESANNDTDSFHSSDTTTSFSTTTTAGTESTSDGLKKKLDSLNDNNSDLDPVYNNEQPKQSHPLLIISESESVLTLSKLDEAELNAKLKYLEKDIVYLDFLFAKKGVDKIAVIVETEKSKVESALKDMANAIFKKLMAQIKGINTSEDRQLNYYSEFLRTPNERGGDSSSASTLSSTSFLSIKLVNKKTVVARMNKFKADLYLLLNLVDSALLGYSYAYSHAKKEADSIWAMSALEGLCISSYIYLSDTRQLSNSSSTTSISTRSSQADISQACEYQ